jgi:hypothetical protein
VPTINFYVTPQSLPPSDFFSPATGLEGSSLGVLDTGIFSINVPIPAGVNQGFAIAINLMSIRSDGGVSRLQRFTHAVARDGFGALRTNADAGFGSANGMERLERMGAGSSQPAFSNGAVNANDVQYDFQNSAGLSMDVFWQVVVSPPKALTP